MKKKQPKNINIKVSTKRGPVFAFSLPGDRLAPLILCQLCPWSDPLIFPLPRSEGPNFFNSRIAPAPEKKPHT